MPQKTQNTYSARHIQSCSRLPLFPPWARRSLRCPPTDRHVTGRGSSPVSHPVQSSPLMTGAYLRQTSRSRLAVENRKQRSDSWRGFLSDMSTVDSKNMLMALWFCSHTCSPAAADWAWSSKEKRPSSMTVLVRCNLDTAREYIISSTVSLASRRTTFTGLWRVTVDQRLWFVFQRFSLWDRFLKLGSISAQLRLRYPNF